MKPIQIVLLIVLVLLAGVVVLLAVRNRQPPVLPGDRDHATFVDAETCLACHGPDAAFPQTKNHPVGRECMRCHGTP